MILEQFQPRTRILGIEIKTITDPETKVERQAWKKPIPREYVMHFKTAADRPKFEALPEAQRTPTDPQAKKFVTMVPVYNGIGSKTLHQMQQNQKYNQKLLVWERKKAMQNVQEVSSTKTPAQALTPLQEAEKRIAKGGDFTLQDIAAIVGENRADKLIQRLRKKGLLRYRREGNKSIWSLTDAGQVNFFNTFRDA